MKKIIFIFIIFTSCVIIRPPYGKAYGYKKKHIFWYYPEYEIYYNPSTKVYIVFKNNQWIFVNTPPFKLEKYIIIESDDDKPWERHHIYKEKFKIKKKKK
uniref:Uncharacterized protein n=1 Tax=candidate division WOR-3 bacterium TaxID=2052148 RepID=A0A7C4YGT9_UNCW3